MPDWVWSVCSEKKDPSRAETSKTCDQKISAWFAKDCNKDPV